MADSAFDDVTVEELRALGGLKWSLYPEAIGMFVAESDLGTAPAVTEALHAAVGAGTFGYLPPALLAGMSEACAGWSRDRYGWAVPPERVRPLADVLAGLAAAIEHFSRPGSPVILPTPAYMPFLTLPAVLGREVIEVPMARDGDRYGYDLDALDAAFRAGGHLLVLCNPHNPIGRVLEPAEMTAVAEVVDRHGGRVFSDEIHAPLVFPGSRHVPYASLDDVTAGHAVTATSASKAWNLPGLKCAQLVLSNEADAAVWARVGLHAEHGPPPSGSWRTPPPTPAAQAGWTRSSPTSTATAGCWPSSSAPTCPASGTPRPRAPIWPGWTAANSTWPSRACSSSNGPGWR
jgi:cystathionine beta-lyase